MKNRLLFLSLLTVLLGGATVGPLQAQVYTVPAGNTYAVLEAERHTLLDPARSATAPALQVISDPLALEASAVAVLGVDPGPGGANLSVVNLMTSARLQYNLVLPTAGDYFVWVRYRTTDANPAYLYYTPLPNCLPSATAPLPATAAGTYEWQNLGTFTVLNDDLGRILSFSLTPWNTNLVIDRVVLLLSTNQGFTEDILTDLPTTPQEPVQFPPNTLQYTSAEGSGIELDLDQTQTSNVNVIDTTGNAEGKSFSYLGAQAYELRPRIGQTTLLVTEPIDLTCGYGQLTVDMRYLYTNNANSLPPTALLTVRAYFYTQLLGNNPPTLITAPFVSAGSASVIQQMPGCYRVVTSAPITIPFPSNYVQLHIEYSGVDNPGSSIFVDELRLSGLISPLISGGGNIGAITVDSNTGIATIPVVNVMPSSTLYLDLGDGTVLGPITQDTTLSYAYSRNGSYTLGLFGRDNCGNGSIALQFNTILVSSPALPVTWLSFTAQASGPEVRLAWSTAAEVDNDYFVIEYSHNGVAFDEVGRVAGSGTQQQVARYQFAHRPGVGGLHYYRLRQVDYDGTYSYSPLREVRTAEARSPVAYPNPASHTLALMGSDAATAYKLYNALGQLSQQGELIEPIVSVEQLPAGWYTLQLFGQGQQLLHTQVVQIK